MKSVVPPPPFAPEAPTPPNTTSLDGIPFSSVMSISTISTTAGSDSSGGSRNATSSSYAEANLISAVNKTSLPMPKIEPYSDLISPSLPLVPFTSNSPPPLHSSLSSTCSASFTTSSSSSFPSYASRHLDGNNFILQNSANSWTTTMTNHSNSSSNMGTEDQEIESPGPSTSHFTPSTVDVDAIKRSPTHIPPETSPDTSNSRTKTPLVTIPENWASLATNVVSTHPLIPNKTKSAVKSNFNSNSKGSRKNMNRANKAKKHQHHQQQPNMDDGDESDDEESDSNSDDSNSSCSHSDESDDDSNSGYSGSTSSTCSSADEDNSGDSSSSSCCSDQSCAKKKSSGSSKYNKREKSPQFKASKSVIRTSNKSTMEDQQQQQQQQQNSSNNKPVEVKQELQCSSSAPSSSSASEHFGNSSFQDFNKKSASSKKSEMVAKDNFSKPFPPKSKIPQSGAVGQGGVRVKSDSEILQQHHKVRINSLNSVDKSRLIVKKSDVTGRRIYKSAEARRAEKAAAAHSNSAYRSIPHKIGSGNIEMVHEKPGGASEIAQLAEQLGQIGKESSNVSFNSISGGLAEIDDADLVAILKDVSAEVSEPSAEEYHEDEKSDDESCDSDTQRPMMVTNMNNRFNNLQHLHQQQTHNTSSSTTAAITTTFSEALVVSEALNRIDLTSHATAGSVTHQRRSWATSGSACNSTLPINQVAATTMNKSQIMSPHTLSTNLPTSKGSFQKTKKNKKSKTTTASTSTSTLGHQVQNQPQQHSIKALGNIQPAQYHLPHLAPNAPMQNLQVPIHTQQQQQQSSSDMDSLYINCAASNVSPDSGIQSEGVASSSPLHLGDGTFPTNNLVMSGNPMIHSQGFHPAFHGTNYSATTGPSNLNSLNLWPQSQQQQQQPGQNNFYGQFLPQPHYPVIPSPSSSTSSSFPYNMNNAVQQQPIMSGQATKSFQVQTQGMQTSVVHHGGNCTPSPVLIQNSVSSSESSSNSSSSKDKSKRGRGRPKGSKNKVKKVTMECGSQTEASILLEANRSSTDSDTSGGSLPPPPLSKFVGAPHSETKSHQSRGRPRKDPPMLVPQVAPPAPSISSAPPPTVIVEKKFVCDRYLPLEEKVKSAREFLKKKKKYEVIVLDSDDENAVEEVLGGGAYSYSNSSDDDEERTKMEEEINAKIQQLREKMERKRLQKEREAKLKKKLKAKTQTEIKLEAYRRMAEQKTSSSFAHRTSTSSISASTMNKPNNTQSKFQHHRSVTPKSERDSSQSPVRSPTLPPTRLSRQETFMSCQQTNLKKYSFTNGEVRPVFDKKFATLKPEQFWRSPAESSRSVSRSSPQPPVLEDNESKRTSSAESVRVLTKASLKELPPFQVHAPVLSGGGASTKTMLSVLAEANQKIKPGRKKRGRRSKSSEWSEAKTSSGRSNFGVSPGSSCHSSKSPFSPRSNPSSFDGLAHREIKYSDMLECSEGYKNSSTHKSKKKKKDKSWKSKHKNVIDPLFLSEVEHLIQDISSCQIESKLSAEFWPDRPKNSVPSIFRKRKITTIRNKRASEDKRKGRGKRASKDLDSEAYHSMGESKTTDTDTAEQRLPLKKRHHHNIPKPPTANIAEDVKLNSSPSSSNLSRSKTSSPQNAELIQNKTASVKRVLQQQQQKGFSDISIIHENKNASSKRTAADKIGEKFGMQNMLRRKSKEQQQPLSSKHTLKILEENSEKILGKYERKGNSKNLALSLSGLSPSKPLPPTASTSATTPSTNFMDSIAACVNKYTNLDEESVEFLTKPLSVETSNNKVVDKSAPKSPRKRHLLEMRQKQQGLDEIDSGPPTLNNESLTSKKESLNSILEIKTTSIDNMNNKLNSPPRLSPQHVYSPVQENKHSFEFKLNAHSSGSSGEETALNLWSVTSSSTSSDDDKKRKKRKGKKKPNNKKVNNTKYSDISDEEFRPRGGLKLTLKREKPKLLTSINTTSAISSMDDVFTQLQKSAPKKHVKLTPMLPLDPGSSEPIAPINVNLSGNEMKSSESESEILKPDDELAKITTPIPPASKPKPLSAKMGKRGRKPKVDIESETVAVSTPEPLIEEDLEQALKPAVVKVDQKIIKPKILKSCSSNSGSDGDDTNRMKEKKKLSLQKCSVRVQKLTRQEIIESSPSPPSFPDHQIISNEEENESVKETNIASDKVEEKTSEKAKLETVITPSILKRRKRKANKTGFPSAKRKKRATSLESPSGSRTSSVNSGKIGKRRKLSKSGESLKLPKRSSDRKALLEKRKAEKLEKEEVAKKKREEEEETEPSTVDGKEDILSQAISQLQHQEEQQGTEVLESKMKRPRGRPPKKRVTANSKLSAEIPRSDSESQSRDGSLTMKFAENEVMGPGTLINTDSSNSIEKKRSKLYDDVDDEVDCLALLPALGIESEQSSEAPSGTEGEDSRSSSVSSKNRKKKKSDMPKKTSYLKAGLFSDSFKDTENEPSNGNDSITLKKFIAYIPEEHPHGLLPPPYYCGRQLRVKQEDFQLPYDLWWLQANKQLPGRDVAATWNYRKIKNNIYYDVKPVAQFESQACQCTRPTDKGIPGCGEDCINRMTYAECEPRLCPLEDRCTNNAIQKHRAVQGIERFMTESKGWGMKTKQAIPSGEFIIEYVGEVVSEKVFKHRMLHEYVEDSHHYCLHLDGGIVIDGHRVGGECRFVNHSCEPNCEIQKWTVNGLYRMALFSLRDIKPGEELTYDYNFSLFNPHEGQSCKCGSENCRGVIGGRTQRINGFEDNSGSGDRSRHPSQERGKDRKKNKNAINRSKKFLEGMGSAAARMPLLAPIKPMSTQQQDFVREHRCFLMRNLEKLKRVRENLQKKVNGHLANNKREERAKKPEDMILTGLTALATARSMQTRRLAIAQDDPNVTKVVKLAQLLREIFAQVTTIADENGMSLSRYFSSLPSKKKHPQYYNLISDPVDFQSIDRNINIGFYNSADQFDKDLLRLCQNNLRYYGHFSKEGSAALKMRKMYNVIKQEYYPTLEEIVGSNGALCFKKMATEEINNPEDVISCPCGQYKDEGVMIQCETCQAWQHCDCVGVSGDIEKFFCDKCEGRKSNLDIVLVPQPEYASSDEKYFTSLTREDLQICLDDTVYVLRAPKNPDLERNLNSKVKSKKMKIAGKDEGKKNLETKSESKKDDNKISETQSNTIEEVKGDKAKVFYPEGKPVQNLTEKESEEKLETDGDTKEKNEMVLEKEKELLTCQDEKQSVDDKDQTENVEFDVTKPEKEYNHGGIAHKLMSPLKGPAQKASTLTQDNYPTFKTVDPDSISTSDMDIFRIERLWINEKGERFAFGHHYLRPHETFHEPNRKFFHNEVFRVPIYEVLPLDTIWGKCWVLDIPNFCKGRPVGAEEEHVYICEYRVDKTARLFNKISKPKHNICTKWFAFDFFDEKLKPQRTFAPHEVPEKWKSNPAPRSRSLEESDHRSRSESSSSRKAQPSSRSSSVSTNESSNSLSSKIPHQLTRVLKKKNREEQKNKLDSKLLMLLSTVPEKNRIDASYLLESDKRLRKKPAA